MKKHLVTLLFFLATGFSFAAFGQCNSDLYSEKSMKNIAPGFLYEKSYRVDGKGGRTAKVEYTCILSKDTNYSFTMNSKDGGSNGMVFSLFDQKRNKVASNFINNKFFTGIQYKCNATGIYFLNFTFQLFRSC